MSRKKVTEAMRAEMAIRYAKGESSWQIGKAMGFLNVCIIKNLNKAGIQLRDRSTAAKTYSVNQDYFKEIDTPTKAYILGLIWADGNMSKDSFTLALKDSDKYLLERIAKEIGSTGPLNFRKRQEPQFSDMWALRVHDKFFCAHLKNKGVAERKTGKLRFPRFLKKAFQPQFILGVLDGDGCISNSGKSKRGISLNIAGSEHMILDLQQILLDATGQHMSYRYKPQSEGCTITCSSTAALTVLNYLYKNPPPFFMTRKYHRYRDYVSSFDRGRRTFAHTKRQTAIAQQIIQTHGS